MYMTYTLFKLLHIVAAIIWVGGLAAVGLINARLARGEDRSTLAAMARQSRFFGTAVVAPAAFITLIAGIGMVAVSGLGAPLWIIWGFAAIVLSIALGATFLRRTGTALSECLQTAGVDDSRTKSLQRRLATLSIINLLLLFSAVGAMVFKPTL